MTLGPNTRTFFCFAKEWSKRKGLIQVGQLHFRKNRVVPGLGGGVAPRKVIDPRD